MATRKKSEKRPDFVKALRALIDDSSISEEVILDAVKEAMAKAYVKQKGMPDLMVRAEFDEKNQLRLFQQRSVVEEVFDDEFEISLEDAKKVNPDAKLDDLIDEPIDLTAEENQFDRASAVLAKNVLKQKIREGEKAAVYEEYADKIEELVNGTVESVEEKYLIVNLGKTLAMMPKGAQIPGETYKEGEVIKVVVSEVNKETKGAQVLVSRADANLVKRLFENEVPEIYDGTVEIKAIAREAGERTKMAVLSHNENVDAIGSCIGPKGQRVQAVMDELHGEKIDIFEWSEDTVTLIKNALAPAVVLGVIENPEGKGLIVVVPDNQLSLAIGKKGKNARLAVKLTNLKIDIKSEADMAEKGINYHELALATMVKEEPVTEEVKEETVEPVVSEEVVNEPEVMEEVKAEPVAEEVKEEAKPAKKTAKKEPKKDAKAVAKEVKENIVKERGVKNTDFVSRFEAFADANATSDDTKKSYRKKKAVSEDDERRLHMNLKDIQYEIKPEYTEEELEEIAANEAELENQYDDDIDYDEYDKYYDENE